MQMSAIFARYGKRNFFLKKKKQKGPFHSLTGLMLSENAFSSASALQASQGNYGMARANMSPLVGLPLSIVFQSFLLSAGVGECGATAFSYPTQARHFLRSITS